MIPLHFLSPLPCLQRGRRGSWMLSRSTQDPAITRFTSAAVAGCDGRPLRAFLLKPVTGRTHQLRVAMKSLGAPVLGDEVRKGGVGGQGMLVDGARGQPHQPSKNSTIAKCCGLCCAAVCCAVGHWLNTSLLLCLLRSGMRRQMRQHKQTEGTSIVQPCASH